MFKGNLKFGTGTFFQREEKQQIKDEVDEQFDLHLVRGGKQRLAFLFNFKTTTITDDDMNEYSAFMAYFIDQSGQMFKGIIKYSPYFYLSIKNQLGKEITKYLEQKYEKKILMIQQVEKVDLEVINHLSGQQAQYLKLSFNTINDLMFVRNLIQAKLDQKQKNQMQYSLSDFTIGNQQDQFNDLSDAILDIREYDVPYHSRVCIDLNIRASRWYWVHFSNGFITFMREHGEARRQKLYENQLKIEQAKPTMTNEEYQQAVDDLYQKQEDEQDQTGWPKEVIEKHKHDGTNSIQKTMGPPDMKILAYDIETSQQPLQFPDSQFDMVMMISLMYEDQAYLIVNRNICGQDVIGFDYEPKPEFLTSATVYNEPDEKRTIQKFFEIIQEYKPIVISSFNGDNFDFPFIDTRARINGISLGREVGVFQEDNSEYFGHFITHLDCLYWVVRDAYLPQGSHGLKAVTRSKLGYEPIEVDPELMVPLARENTQKLAEYSISDSVATYFLYKKHIHDFIFALCSIIPMCPDEVLRKGSGTLCENLLMAKAFTKNIIFPNKKQEEPQKFYNGHLLASETYIGGKVECLHSGVYRSDIKTDFNLDASAFDELIKDFDNLLRFILEVENQDKDIQLNDIVNRDEIKNDIVGRLESLRDVPTPRNHLCYPLIYHLDVAAMYPNIILTNRLQPVAIVDNKACSGCLFNAPQNACKRPLEWQWKGEYYPLSRSDYESIKSNTQYEFAAAIDEDPNLREKQDKELQQRVKLYCQKNSGQIHVNQTDLKQNTVCMRENSFYIDTVRDFRDRRYDYKDKVKIQKDVYEKSKNSDPTKAQEAQDLMALYESLQLAHKIILNSFYGYVMRQGARWYSMQMAAMVTHIGASIISDAKQLVDCIGQPLELDTDGIWCLLPRGFPEKFTLKLRDGKIIRFDYPCSLLNNLVYEKFKNPQYQVLKNSQNPLDYTTRTEMSIFFEIDGPYRAMVIPAAREEGKLLKKRYVVFKENGSISELKGFEIKRRGELNILKIFQKQIFSEFLKGKTIQECYGACSKVASKWLNLLKNKGQGLQDEEVLDYIGESQMLSRELNDYGLQKGTGITAAKRMMEFLGAEIVKGKGLNCNLVISKKPIDTPVTQRSIPISIFNADPAVRRKFLRKWTKETSEDPETLELRNVLDWDYYIERLSNAIQKIIIIPAIKQGVYDILPDVQRPDWVVKQIKARKEKRKQQKLQLYFEQGEAPKIENIPGFNRNKTPFKSSQRQITEVIPKAFGNKITPSSQLIPVKQQAVIMDNPYDLNTHFKEWLKVQKSIWNEERQSRKHLFSKTGGHLMNQPQTGLQTMLLKNIQVKLNSNWMILQILPTDTLGIYKLWVMLDNSQISSIYVEIPRVIYANSYNTQEQSEAKKLVQKRLPRQTPSHFLYEITMTEEEYTKSYGNFDLYLTNPDLEGIYETKLPLDIQFITLVGNQAQLSQTSEHSSFENGIKVQFNNIQGNFNPQSEYLSQQTDVFTSSLKHVYLASQKMLNYQVWALLDEFRQEYNFIFVHDGRDTEKYARIVKESIPRITFPPESRIRTHNFQNSRLAVLFLDRLLIEIKESLHGGNQLVVTQTHLDFAALRQLGLRSLGSDFPTLPLNSVRIHKENVNSLTWKTQGIKFICALFNELPGVLDNLRSFCAFAQIPLCNTRSDDLQDYATNVIFGRLLHASNCISWYGEYCRKLGGGGSQNLSGNSQSLSAASSIDYSLLIPTDFLPSEIINPGLYTDYTVEINIQLLVLNTIVKSDELKNIDTETSQLIDISKVNPSTQIGTATNNQTNQMNNNTSNNNYQQNQGKQNENQMSSNQDTQGKSSQASKQDKYTGYSSNKNSVFKEEHMEIYEKPKYQQNHSNSSGNINPGQVQKPRQYQSSIDQLTAAQNSFRSVKMMTQGWLEDVEQYQNLYSNNLINHIHRWIVNDESMFYDPVLARMLGKLCQQIYTFLVQDILSQNAGIVYANMHKLIISTGQNTKREAENYTKFVLSSVVAKPLFSKISLAPTKWKSIFLFQDMYNQSYIQDLNEQESESQMEEIGRGVGGVNYETNWQIAEFLPPIIKQTFLYSIYEYLEKLYQEKQRILDPLSEDYRPDIILHFKKYMTEFSRDYISNHLETKMISYLPNLDLQYKHHQFEDEKRQQILARQQEEQLQFYSIYGSDKKKLLSTQMNDNDYYSDIDEDGEIYSEDEYEEDSFVVDERPNHYQKQKALKEVEQSLKNPMKLKNSKEKSQSGMMVMVEELKQQQQQIYNKPQSEISIEQSQFMPNQGQRSEDQNIDSQQVDEEMEIKNNQGSAFVQNLNALEEEPDNELDEIDVGGQGQYEMNDDLEEGKEQRLFAQWIFPDVTGAQVKYDNPILEFVNFLCFGLGIDQNIHDELILLKRNCLRQINVSQFTDSAEYKEPCLKIRLNDILCSHCYLVQDIEIFRGEYSCMNCQEPFENFYIQSQIIQFYKNNMTFYQLQDLYCLKCNKAKEDNLCRNCQCAGHYKLNVDEISNPLALQQNQILYNLKQLAAEQGFNLLKDLM